jgi:hypothetical protein
MDAGEVWFREYKRTDKKFDITVTCRFVGFGNLEEKKAFYDLIKGSDWSDSDPYGLCVYWCPEKSILLMEIRENDEGQIILPIHVLGHEFAHVLDFSEENRGTPEDLLHPDKYGDE